MNLTFPAEQRNAYFSVQPDQLDFEYLDTIYNLNVREEFVLYRIPSLKLFSPVDPQKTEFKFLNTSIKVQSCFGKISGSQPIRGTRELTNNLVVLCIFLTSHM
jgi:hypothetical protein